MKRSNKITHFFRQTLLFALCLVCILGLTPLKPSFAEATESGYKWTRVKNQQEFLDFFREYEVTTTDSGGRTKTETKKEKVSDSDKLLSSDENWWRVLLVFSDYDVGKDKIRSSQTYFFSGSAISGEDYVGQPVKPVYDIDVSQDSFTTRSGLGTPYIKYMGMDNDNNAPKCSLAFMSDYKVGPNCLIGDASWYGFVNHAAYDMQFVVGPRSNPGSAGKKNNKWVSNVTTYGSFTMEFHDSLAHMYYNLSGVSDAYWFPNGGASVNPDGGDWTESRTACGFKVFIGVPEEVPLIDRDFTVEAGEVEVWDGKSMSITHGTQVTVEEGATLVVRSLIYNNGVIVVDGGTLVVQGVVDSDAGYTTTMRCTGVPDEEACPGTIYVMNNGQLIVEDSGVLLTRYISVNGGASIRLSGNSSAFISGFAALAHGISAEDHSTVRVAPGGLVTVGVIPRDTVSHSNFNTKASEISKHYLDSLCYYPGSGEVIKKDSSGNVINPNAELPFGIDVGVYVKDNSSFINMGGLFMGANREWSCSDNSYVFAYTSKNIYSSVGSMLWTTLKQ